MPRSSTRPALPNAEGTGARKPCPFEVQPPPVDLPIADWAAELGVSGLAVVGIGTDDFELLGGEVSGWPFGDETVEALRAGHSVSDTLPDGSTTTALPVHAPDGDVIGALIAVSCEPSTFRVIDRLSVYAPATAAALTIRSLQMRVSSLESKEAMVTEKLRGITDATSTGVVILDTEGHVCEINEIAAAIAGRPPSEILGHSFERFIAESDVEESRRRMEARLAGMTAARVVDLQVKRPSGELRLITSTASPMVADGEIVGIVFACNDVTDERARDVQIRRAERLSSLAPLLGGVCHELNNPLTSIKSFAELMLLDERPDDDVEALEIVRREAARAARIVTDLRLVARQTQDDGSTGDILDLNELAREGADQIFGECEVLGIRVELNLDPQLPEIYGNQPQLERLIGQLLSNAVRALDGYDGIRKIIVTTTTGEKSVALRIEDSGPGIAEEDVEKIFDPFWTTRTAGEGTGLGLSLAHSIVSDHRGQIHVEGNSGSGAVFSVELPLAGHRQSTDSEQTVHKSTTRPLSILIVDDEGPIRYSLGRYMNRRGHAVEEAEDGNRALEILERERATPFDIILADLRMPGLNGEQLYQRLSERGDGIEERLIFITGDAHSEGAAEFVAQAGVPVVLKPFELAEIAQIIEAQASIFG